MINWDHTRKDLSQQLFRLSDQFELVFIFEYKKVKDYPGLRVIYWNDFSTPEELLDKIKPSQIIFHDIESFHQIALTITARAKNIRTIVLEHGLRRAFEVANTIRSEKNTGIEISISSIQTVRFLLASLSKLKFSVWPSCFRLLFLRKFQGLTKGLRSCQYEFRQADLYINFTERNSGYIKERDGIKEEKLRYIGNPQFDEFFQKLRSSKLPEKKKRILLFDTPFEQIPGNKISLEQRKEFIQLLSVFFRKQGLSLTVKLHPRSDPKEFQLPDVEFISEGDLFELIMGSEGCVFIHNSGLIPLSMLYNKTILFNAIPALNTDLLSDAYIPIYEFNARQIAKIELKEIDDKIREKVVKDYFLSTEGNSESKLREILTDQAL